MDVGFRHGVRVMIVEADGAPSLHVDAAAGLRRSASAAGAQLVVVPVGRLNDDFFDLTTGVARRFVDALGESGIRIAVVGDASGRATTGRALTAWMAEENRGERLLFVPSMTALDSRLADERRRRTGEVQPYPGRKV